MDYLVWETDLNSLIAEEIRREIDGIDLYVPQENDAINIRVFMRFIAIALADMERLNASDFLVAVIEQS